MSKDQGLKIFSNFDKELQQSVHLSKSPISIKTTSSSLKARSREQTEGKDGNITLEKVVRDMAHVFNDLKDGISLVSSGPKKEPESEVSSFNIEHELERIYKKQEQINREKEEERKRKEEAAKAKQQPQRRNANKQNQRPNSPNIIANQKSKPPNLRSPSTLRSGSPKASSEPAKVVVTNIKFPQEVRGNLNATSSSIKAPINQTMKTRPVSPEAPSLRKPSQTSGPKRALSVPPPREIYNPLGIIKDEVDRAVRDRKTFTIKGQFPAVRRALLKRGWIEKYHPNYRDRLNDDIKKYLQLGVGELVDLLRNRSISDTVKKILKSKLLKDHQVDLYWDHSFDAFKECSDAKKLTLINKFRREAFSYTSKQGLCQTARESHWLHIPGVARINHPRCYLLTKGGDTKSFLKDFGLTAATSLLKWVVRNNITGESKIVSESGKIPMRIFDFAIAECYKFIKTQTHQDIDEDIREALEVEWNDFLEQYYKAVHVGNHFKLPDKSTIHPSQEAKDMVRKSNYLLNQLREYMTCLDMDGYMNIWILKPTNSSRGEGIHICRTLQFILDIIRKNPNRRYIIQKYIERPFLIHDTKFDIRQWFLVTSAYPLTIWLYKLCYLRFSSQTYNLRKLHESIHLTNNSVQAKYLQRGTNDPLLPPYGMWDSKQFKSYLSDIGYPHIFETSIYPGMKQCITAAMIAHRDKIDRRENCFELYGADFMLSEKFEPWMLEINSNPALHASTPVTAKLCPEVLEDVIKVVVDNARNPRAPTGNFELIYKEKSVADIKDPKEKFKVTGNPVPESYFCDVPHEEIKPKPPAVVLPKKFEPPDPGKHLLQTGQSMKDALKNLLEIVKREKLKRHGRREKSTEAKSKTGDSFIQTRSDVISLYQSVTISKISSADFSESVIGFNSEDEMSENEVKKVTEALDDLRSLQNKKQILSSLVKVVDTLKSAKKRSKYSHQ